MSPHYLLELLNTVEDHIKEDGEDVSVELVNLDFLRDEVNKGSVKSVAQIIAYALYISTEKWSTPKCST